jgi:uncharacterized protein
LLSKFEQQVYEEDGESKNILWLDTSNHIDLYDNEKYVEHVIAKIIEWFRVSLAKISGVSV